MENHPIPQDVTGFQFKLIGTMTVKQFGYVASGVVMAVVLYYLPINSAFGILFKVLLIPLLGASGAIVAFVPVDGRPIDVMTTNFVKAIFSPNQYIYHRQGRQLSFTTVSVSKVPAVKKTQQKTQSKESTPSSQLEQKEEKLRALLLNSREKTKSTLDKKEDAFLQTIALPTTSGAIGNSTVTSQTVHEVKQSTPFHQQTSSVVNAPSSIAQVQIQAAHPPLLPQNNPNENPKKENQTTSQTSHVEVKDTALDSHSVTQQKMEILSKQVQEIHAQKQQLEQELSHLQNQLATQKDATQTLQTKIPGQPLQDPQHVRVIPQDVSKKAGLPHVSDSPNVVVGIVKDPRGNVLPNILVEVKDKDGNPVRAFKTNQLGQFASATPLSPGSYTIELEDPKKQQRFSIVQINANNQILLPIEIISHDAREELRKELFAN